MSTSAKQCKTSRYEHVFKSTWSDWHGFLKASRKGQKFAFCELCRANFSIGHGGYKDCRKHVQTAKHASAAHSTVSVGNDAHASRSPVSAHAGQDTERSGGAPGDATFKIPDVPCIAAREDKDPLPFDCIVKVKVEAEFMEYSVVQNEDNPFETKRFQSNAPQTSQETLGKVFVKQEPSDALPKELRSDSQPIRSDPFETKCFQSNAPQTFQETLGKVFVKQEPSDALPKELSSDSQLIRSNPFETLPFQSNVPHTSQETLGNVSVKQDPSDAPSMGPSSDSLPIQTKPDHDYTSPATIRDAPVATPTNTYEEDASPASDAWSNSPVHTEAMENKLGVFSQTTKSPSWSTEPKDTAAMIEAFFGQRDMVHSSDMCRGKDCKTVSNAELQHLTGTKDRFQHNWLFETELTCCPQTGYRWLVYVEGKGMFCLLCRKHDTANAQNNTKKFNCVPAFRFKRKSLEEHANSSMHQEAVTKELLSRGSLFHKEYIHKENTRLCVYQKGFQTIYWVAKEEISNRKFTQLLDLLEQVGLTDMKYFQHRSDGSVREMFLILGRTIKQQIIRKVQQAGSFGLLLDEVCDVTETKQLVTFVQFVDAFDNKAKVNFLSTDNFLLESTSANAETMKTVILQQLKMCGLDIHRASGLASDGASVMLSKRNGLAAKLRAVSDTLLSVHCICHRLALACGDANDEVSYIQKVENILVNLRSFFNNSAKRTTAYAKVVETSHQVDSTATQQTMRKWKESKKLQEAVRTRWSSTQNSIVSVYENYNELTQTLRQLKEEGDPTATGLLAQVGTIQFISAVYLLSSILPILDHLSRSFQKGAISFASISPAIEFTLDSLKDVANEQKPLKQLKEDLLEGGRLAACDIPTLTESGGQQLANLTEKYVLALTENINNRFQNSLEVLTAFRIFDPTTVPDRSTEEFKEYGLEDVRILGRHFSRMSDQKEKMEELEREWKRFKYELLELKKKIPREVLNPPIMHKNHVAQSPTEWLLEKTLSTRSTYEHFVPMLVHIMEVCLSLPLSNTWPERGAPAVKRVKTLLRNRIKQDMLESLLHISINGPKVKESGELIAESVEYWKKLKNRRKLMPSR
uniref:zinc finger protein 862-like isoform X1 n=1 Tax=Myxine glutinosa TaxID=7769 RepID=UPI00358E7E09